MSAVDLGPHVAAVIEHEVAMHAPPLSFEQVCTLSVLMRVTFVPMTTDERQRLCQEGYAEHRTGDCPICAAGTCKKCARGDVLGRMVEGG